MYDFDYSTVTDEASLEKSLISFFKKSNSPKLLEIFTPSEINDKVLLDYFKFIK